MKKTAQCNTQRFIIYVWEEISSSYKEHCIFKAAARRMAYLCRWKIWICLCTRTCSSCVVLKMATQQAEAQATQRMLQVGQRKRTPLKVIARSMACWCRLTMTGEWRTYDFTLYQHPQYCRVVALYDASTPGGNRDIAGFRQARPR